MRQDYRACLEVSSYFLTLTAWLSDRTLQESIKSTADSYLDRLDKFAGQSDGMVAFQTPEGGQEIDALSLLDERLVLIW